MPAADARLDELLGAGAEVFRTSMDLLPDPISVWWAARDARGAVVGFETGYANPAMLALFGVSGEPSLGRRLLEESPAYRQEAAFRIACQVVETRVPAVVESVVDRAAPIGRLSGSFIHRAVPFGPNGVMNLLSDITSQRRSEAELERYAQIAAHDLREPLMAVGLFVEQLASGLDRGDAERNEQLVTLLRADRAPHGAPSSACPTRRRPEACVCARRRAGHALAARAPAPPAPDAARVSRVRQSGSRSRRARRR